MERDRVRVAGSICKGIIIGLDYEIQAGIRNEVISKEKKILEQLTRNNEKSLGVKRTGKK